MKTSAQKFHNILESLNLGNPLSRFFFLFGILSVFLVIYLGCVSVSVLQSHLLDDLSPANAEVQVVSNSLNGFKTNLTKSSINLDVLYKAGPVKGSIPPISVPIFENIEDSSINNDEKGILVKFDSFQRFYPINILTWHEVVNDKYVEYPFAVTYSPLTGTSAVFERKVDDEVLKFGATGMLYQSNLVMYDSKTDSLWSQNERRSIVGDYNETKLTLIPFSIVTAGYVLENYPQAQVLTTDTGFIRDYTNNPYSEYENSDVVYADFGISKFDAKFHPKSLLYSVPFGNKVYSAFIDDLDSLGEVTFDEDNYALTITKSGEEISAEVLTKDLISSKNSNSKIIPGYYEMWFSWAVKHEADGILFGSI